MNPIPSAVKPDRTSSNDWAFIGMGAGNCILLHLMKSEGLLDNRGVVVIDPVRKTEDDKTYCFWAGDEELAMVGFAGLVSNSWPHVIIDDEHPQPIAPKRYHRIRSIDLYQSTQRLLQDIGATELPLQVASVVPPRQAEADPILLQLSDGKSIAVNRVFDSRPPRFLQDNPNDVSLVQSFVGFRIALRSPSENWRADAIRMMDFQVPQGPESEVQFMYVLPEGPQEGLVELTRFAEKTLDQEAAAPVLTSYITSHFGAFDILSVECGRIPMSTAPMQHTEAESHPRWTSIGTRAGAVKPSTGYAFKAMTAHANDICRKLLASPAGGMDEVDLARSPGPKRFRFYDHLLLLILRDEPHLGKPIFQRLFATQRTCFVLDFLDEKTTLGQEAGMFARLQIMPFLRALAKRSLGLPGVKSWLPSLLWFLAALTFFALEAIAETAIAETAVAIVLVGGLVGIGIPHGALDAVTSVSFNGQKTWAFYAQYLAILAATMVGWWYMPNLTLLIFLAMSAWHFGQGDTQLWGQKSAVAAGGWGALVLAFLLGHHLLETGQILLPLHIHAPALEWLQSRSDLIGTGLWGAWGIVTSTLLFRRNWPGILSAITLAMAAQMPLLLGFGSYFIFHHSVSGWSHLRRGTALSHKQLYVKGFPFTLAAFAFLGAGIMWLVDARDSSAAVGAFFAALSALSLPHIISSHVFLKATANPKPRNIL